MPATKLTAKRINTFLQHLGSLVNSLPTREQKDEIERELDTVISFLTDFKARLTGLPMREDEASLEQSLKVLRHFVAVAEADPLISRTLGLNTKPSRTRSGTARPRTRPDISAMVDQLKASSPEEIRETLSQKASGCTVPDLKQIAASMGVRVRSKTPRWEIVDQIVKRAENEAGYDYLREHA